MRIGRSIHPLSDAVLWAKTEITSTIPTQKSKDASRTQNPAFASYLRPSEGQNLKDASRTEDKTQKKSPNTPSDGRNLRPYELNPL